MTTTMIIVTILLLLTRELQAYQSLKPRNKLSRSFLYSTTADESLSEAPANKLGKALTQKEYLITVRNRLYAVEEQIWLHEYATARPGVSKVEPLSEEKYNQLLVARGELMEEYPLTKLYTDIYEAQVKNLTYAAQYLDRLINSFQRQMPLPMDHVNQIAVLSFSGQVINLMRGQGAVYHRLLPSNLLTEPGVKRQFQHPAFSAKGNYLAFAEMHFKETGIVRSDALVFEVPKDPKTYGSFDSAPLFDTGELPGAPFFLRFSPDEESLVMLCTSPSSDAYTALVMIEWGKHYRTDSWAGQAAVARFAPRKALTLIQGNPVFFTYTTSSANNATIVAHCQKEIEDPQTQAMVNEKAVWMLQKQDTGGVQDFKWEKICDSDTQQRWSTPICHSAGGGDSVLVVEDGWLTTKALSRFKRDGSGKKMSKKLMEVRGQVQFLVSPDHSKAVVLQEDINIGHYSLTVIDGEDALDPASESMGNQYELPNPKLTVAFWFSPDSTKLLCLNAAGKSRDDVSTQKGSFRVGLNSEMQWSVFNFPLQELKEYDTFKPTAYFMKTYVPFFSQYAQVRLVHMKSRLQCGYNPFLFLQVYNPWAPDSRSFIYMTSAGLSHTPLVGSKYCLGVDKWQNQGATFGTWSKQ